jgi:hypothetical protein
MDYYVCYWCKTSSEIQIFNFGYLSSGHITVLEAGRWRVRLPMVSVEFFIDIILSAALWPWGQRRL